MKNVRQKEIGTILDRWWKVIVVGCLAVSSCFGAYYMLLGHDADINKLKRDIVDLIEKHDKDIQALRDDYKRQYGVVEDKSNQKFDQGMKVAIELKTRIEKIEDRVNANEQKESYTVGWRDAEKFFKKK